MPRVAVLSEIMMTVWQGKALGALIGLLSGGPAGGAMGLLLGHLLDTGLGNRQPRVKGNAHTAAVAQAVLFRATFQVMGHVAKADGRISEDEIRAARAIMDRMQLDDAQRRSAIEFYTTGKAANFSLRSELRRVRESSGLHPELRALFLQLQVQAALWGGCSQGAGRVVLLRICDELGVSRASIARLEAELRRRSGATQDAPSASSSAVESLRQAYTVLGLTPAATDAQVTKAYRRLINRHHPDKLQAKGLAESQLQLATEKTRQVRTAYERIRDVRQMHQ
jgi:DnaJ like chaperone protein